MKVEWLNCRLTFQADTPEEHEALKAVWVAFGSQIDNRPCMPDQYITESNNLIDSPSAQNGGAVSNKQAI